MPPKNTVFNSKTGNYDKPNVPPEIKSHRLHPLDIALKDTAAFNTIFNQIADYKDLADDAPDDTTKGYYLAEMHKISDDFEAFLSNDSTIVDIGPFFEMWVEEGGKSFSPFVIQMSEAEQAAKLATIHSDTSGIDLSPEQKTQAVAGLDASKAELDEINQYSKEWADHYATAEQNMTSLWNRYEAIKDADPDKDWWAESRFVWWGLADPDNAIQEEIAALGNEYRKWDIASKSGPLPAVIDSQRDKAQSNYDRALEALNNLKGE